MQEAMLAEVAGRVEGQKGREEEAGGGKEGGGVVRKVKMGVGVGMGIGLEMEMGMGMRGRRVSTNARLSAIELHTLNELGKRK